MLRPSMQTLKHIVLDIHGDFVDEDPLFRILSEFEDISTKNNIETVTIWVQLYANSRGGDDWCRLDEVFTTPGWFSLKRVSLAIEIISRFVFWENIELEGVLRKFPETQFPRLSSSKSVSFDFEVIS